MKITRDEVLRLAQLSMLEFSGDELDSIAHDLQALVSHTEEIMNADIEQVFDSTRQVNVFREDRAVAKDRTAILQQAPQSTEDYFVVPKIIEAE